MSDQQSRQIIEELQERNSKLVETLATVRSQLVDLKSEVDRMEAETLRHWRAVALSEAVKLYPNNTDSRPILNKASKFAEFILSGNQP